MRKIEKNYRKRYGFGFVNTYKTHSKTHKQLITNNLHQPLQNSRICALKYVS